ncbi:unnamed protein product [Closterium sp. NIES-53]
MEAEPRAAISGGQGGGASGSGSEWYDDDSGNCSIASQLCVLAVALLFSESKDYNSFHLPTLQLCLDLQGPTMGLLLRAHHAQQRLQMLIIHICSNNNNNNNNNNISNNRCTACH